MVDKYKLIAFHYFALEAIEMNEELDDVQKLLIYAAAWFMCENIVKGDYFAQGLEFKKIEKLTLKRSLKKEWRQNSQKNPLIEKLPYSVIVFF